MCACRTQLEGSGRDLLNQVVIWLSSGRGVSWPLTAPRFDGVPECSSTKAELDAAAAEQVQACDTPGQHRRWPQRQVRHVGSQPDVARMTGDKAEQGRRVEEARLVRMVLERGKVEAGLFAQLRQ